MNAQLAELPEKLKSKEAEAIANAALESEETYAKGYWDGLVFAYGIARAQLYLCLISHGNEEMVGLLGQIQDSMARIVQAEDL